MACASCTCRPTLPTFVDDSDVETDPQCTMDMDEWKFLSQLHPSNNILFDELELGHCDFNANHNWAHSIIPSFLEETTIHFIEFKCSTTQLRQIPSPTTHSLSSLSPSQHMAFNIIFSHFSKNSSKPPLKMLIQGTTGIDKSFLIECLKNSFISTSTNRVIPLLLLSPTGFVAFHIHVLKIYYDPRIPISSM